MDGDRQVWFVRSWFRLAIVPYRRLLFGTRACPRRSGDPQYNHIFGKPDNGDLNPVRDGNVRPRRQRAAAEDRQRRGPLLDTRLLFGNSFDDDFNVIADQKGIAVRSAYNSISLTSQGVVAPDSLTADLPAGHTSRVPGLRLQVTPEALLPVSDRDESDLSSPLPASSRAGGGTPMSRT